MYTRPRLHNRQGFSPILAALLVLAVLGAALFFQSASTRQVAGEVHRAQLAGLARLQAVSALAELRAQVAEEANRPGTALFKLIREHLDDRFEKLDLTPALKKPERLLTPSWGAAGERGMDGVARGSIAGFTATLTASRSSHDIGGSEEWTALLELAVDAGIADAAGGSRRRVREIYELRTLLVGPPRPFDQMGLFLGKLDAVTSPAAANRVRAELLSIQGEIERLRAALPPESVAALGPIATAAEAEQRTPTLPEEPAVVWGFYTTELALEHLDLARDAARHLQEVRQARTEAAAASGPALAAAKRFLAAQSAALNALWQYQRTLTVASRGGESFRERIGRWLPRLTPAHFRDRAHAVPPRAVLEDWLAGKSRLEGVVDATAWPTRLRLTGELTGRVVLLVGPQGADLSDLNRDANALNRLTVVSLGGPLNVGGEVHAALIGLPADDKQAGHGRIAVPKSALLTGSLIVPDAQSANLLLEGRLRYDGTLLAAYPPRETLKHDGAGEYLVAVSPVPLFANSEE